MKKEAELNRIFTDIKSIKIQGASNIAKAALKAYSLSPQKSTIKKLKSLRPTEPMLFHVLNKLSEENLGKTKEQLILNHFSQAQDKINNYVLKIIKPGDIIYTHCHSTNVIKSLINAKQRGLKFQVYNTETRPLYQGRLTAKELSSAGISVTTFVDSAMKIALSGDQGNRKVTKVFLGADAIFPNGNVVNKVGSGLITKLAKDLKIPVYIIADSWKFSPKSLKLEQRNFKEIWANAPSHIKVKDPAFEIIDSKNITKIISDLGILPSKKFVEKARVSV